MILARDIIDMIREYKDDQKVLQYLEGICFSLARLFENKTDDIDWDILEGICDQRYYSLKNGNPIEIDTKTLDNYYNIACSFIEKNAPAIDNAE
jgi:hypothetical protein